MAVSFDHISYFHISYLKIGVLHKPVSIRAVSPALNYQYIYIHIFSLLTLGTYSVLCYCQDFKVCFNAEIKSYNFDHPKILSAVKSRSVSFPCRSICKSYMRNSVGCVLMFDVSQRQTFDRVACWHQEGPGLCETQPRCSSCSWVTNVIWPWADRSGKSEGEALAKKPTCWLTSRCLQKRTWTSARRLRPWPEAYTPSSSKVKYPPRWLEAG